MHRKNSPSAGSAGIIRLIECVRAIPASGASAPLCENSVPHRALPRTRIRTALRTHGWMLCPKHRLVLHRECPSEPANPGRDSRTESDSLPNRSSDRWASARLAFPQAPPPKRQTRPSCRASSRACRSRATGTMRSREVRRNQAAQSSRPY